MQLILGRRSRGSILNTRIEQIMKLIKAIKLFKIMLLILTIKTIKTPKIFLNLDNLDNNNLFILLPIYRELRRLTKSREEYLKNPGLKIRNKETEQR